MKLKTLAVTLFPLLLAHTALALEAKKLVKASDGSEASSLIVDGSDDARQIMDVIPLEALQERIEWQDPQGHTLAYAALAEGKDGALLFIDKKLAGTLTRREAQAFYSCRAYATASGAHWARNAAQWMASLQAASKPAMTVVLQFSGQSTPLSVKEVGSDQTLSQIESLLNIGTNPLGILKKLSAANDSKRERDRLERIANALRAVTLGTTEEKLVEAQKPEEVAYAPDSLVIAWPRFAYEFLVQDGSVRLVQQPSFTSLARSRSALFYVPGAQWQNCTPGGWRNWLPEVPAAKDGKKE